MISFSRIFAIFMLSAFFTIIIGATILETQSIGTQITHGNKVEHKHGFILSKGRDNSLVFKTDNGQVMHFLCAKRCLTEVGHIQRHIYEHAPTDVYYMPTEDTLAAIDVD